MRFSVLASFIFASVGLVLAADDRLLFTIPAGETIAKFTTDFDNACSTWAPAVAAGLTFVDNLVEAGDFQGKNTATQARLVCAWTNGSIQTFTTDVATSLGATPA
ncbi:hypothetical protein DFH06DRAFT_1368601 [Mycena polygramma]|nr:hypothetical protein DFH06DRAFT_1368601 [Mycena polygramma]